VAISARRRRPLCNRHFDWAARNAEATAGRATGRLPPRFPVRESDALSVKTGFEFAATFWRAAAARRARAGTRTLDQPAERIASKGARGPSGVDSSNPSRLESGYLLSGITAVGPLR